MVIGKKDNTSPAAKKTDVEHISAYYGAYNRVYGNKPHCVELCVEQGKKLLNGKCGH